LLKLNPAGKDCPPAVEFPHMHGLVSLPTEYFPFRHLA
jgi:hypothetical protein